MSNCYIISFINFILLKRYMGKSGFGWDVAVQATDCEEGDKCASGPKGVERMKEASAHLCR